LKLDRRKQLRSLGRKIDIQNLNWRIILFLIEFAANRRSEDLSCALKWMQIKGAKILSLANENYRKSLNYFL